MEQFDSVSEVNQIEELLNKRISIINSFLYGDKIPEKLKELEDNLSEIEDEKLLKTDMDILTHIYHNPTEYERATKVKINKVKDIAVTENSVKMLANLQWTILGSDDEMPVETSLIKDYDINCIFKDKKIYLTNMKFVE